MASNLNSGDKGYYESQQNGFYNYPSKVHDKFFVGKCERKTRPVTIKSGQVLKARSLVESDSTGKMVAVKNFTEVAKLTLVGTLADTDTFIVAGRTITATGGVVTAAEVVEILLTGASVGFGILTGSNTLWNLAEDPNSTTKLYFYSTVMGTNVTDLAVTGTHTSMTTASIAKTDGATTYRVPAGVLCFDVDATSADVRASIFCEVNLYATGIVWGVDTAVDVVNVNGTERACTAYNTGCYTELSQQRLLENCEITILHESLGEGATHG
mgnify:CR=1 FL=1